MQHMLFNSISMAESRINGSNICRLCLETLNTTTYIGIDLTTVGDVRALVKEMYTVEVTPKDKIKCICTKCYQRMMTHYKNHRLHLDKKRMVQINHSVHKQMILAAAVTANETAIISEPVLDATFNEDASLCMDTSISVDSDQSVRAQSTTLLIEQNNNVQKKAAPAKAAASKKRQESSASNQKRPSLPSETNSKGSPIREGKKQNRDSSVQSDRKQSRSNSDKKSNDISKNSSSSTSIQKKVGQTTAQKKPADRSLVPVLMNCLTQPQYLDALFPLKISLNSEDVKPLEYLCDNCFLTFKTHKEFYVHVGQSCLQACRYCYAQIKSQHICAFSNKYAWLYPHIKGNNKYSASASGKSHVNHHSLSNGDWDALKSKASVEKQKHKCNDSISKNNDPHKNRPKSSIKTTRNSMLSTSVGNGSTKALSPPVGETSTDSSVELSNYIESASDDEIQTIINDIRKNVWEKIHQASRIPDN